MDYEEVWDCFLMSGERMLHFFKQDWWIFIQIHQYYRYNCVKQCITLSFISTGHSISRRLESDSGFQRQQGDVGYATQDQLVMNREVDDRLSAIQQKQNQLKEYLAERDRKLGSHMQRGELESGIKKSKNFTKPLFSIELYSIYHISLCINCTCVWITQCFHF